MKCMTNAHAKCLAAIVLLGCTSASFGMSKPVDPNMPNTSILPSIEYRNFDSAKSLGSEAWQGLGEVYVAQPTLAFSKHWLREYKTDMSRRDEERIRTKYTSALKEELEEAFEKQGWTVVEHASPKSLVVKPYLSDLRILAPDLTRRPISKDFVEYAGSTRLTLRFETANEGVIGELVDHDQTRNWGGARDLKQTNRTVNYRDFKFLFKKWANRAAKFANSSSGSGLAVK